MGRGFVIALACAVAAALVLPLPAGAQTPRTARPAAKTLRGTIRPASEVEKTGASRLSRPATSTRSGPRLTVPMSMGGASTANAPRPALTEGNQGGLAAGVNLPYSSTPPDSTGAIGPNDYVEVVNSAIADYDRNLSYKGQTVALESESKGYRFKLTPPVPVTVLEGDVKGDAKAVKRMVPLVAVP